MDPPGRSAGCERPTSNNDGRSIAEVIASFLILIDAPPAGSPRRKGAAFFQFQICSCEFLPVLGRAAPDCDRLSR